MSHVIRSPTTTYEVGQLLGRTPAYAVYLVQAVDSQHEYLLKIATDVRHNGLLDREAFLLGEVWREIGRRDAVHAAETNESKRLGYHRCFPQLVESFLVPAQGNRRVSIIAIHGNEPFSSLVPIEQWRTREQVRLDPKSSAWIMGRLLKILTLTQPFGVAIGRLDGSNVLVNPVEQHLTVFDWTAARHHSGGLPLETARKEISAVATQVWFALGGDLETDSLPQSDQLPDRRYAEFLKRLMDSRVSDPVLAGVDFYELIRELWGRSFHQFTTYPL